MKYLKRILFIIAALLVTVFYYLLAVDINFLWLFGKSPSMSTIVNTRPAQASEISSADIIMVWTSRPSVLP